MADAIVELTETGSSLRANNLRIVDTVMSSTTLLIANRKAWLDLGKREKIENLSLLLQGALLAAQSQEGLKRWGACAHPRAGGADEHGGGGIGFCF